MARIERIFADMNLPFFLIRIDPPDPKDPRSIPA